MNEDVDPNMPKANTREFDPVLIKAAREDNISLLKVLMESPKTKAFVGDLTAIRNDENQNLWHIALINRAYSVSTYLYQYLEKNNIKKKVIVDLVFGLDKNKQSLFRQLIKRNDTKLFGKLITIYKMRHQKELDLGIILQADDEGVTPLHLAAKGSDARILKSMLSSLKDQPSLLTEAVNHLDKNGNSPLHLACQENRLLNIVELIAAGASLQLKNKSGNSFFTYFEKNGESLREFLLERNNGKLLSIIETETQKRVAANKLRNELMIKDCQQIDELVKTIKENTTQLTSASDENRQKAQRFYGAAMIVVLAAAVGLVLLSILALWLELSFLLTMMIFSGIALGGMLVIPVIFFVFGIGNSYNTKADTLDQSSTQHLAVLQSIKSFLAKLTELPFISSANVIKQKISLLEKSNTSLTDAKQSFNQIIDAANDVKNVINKNNIPLTPIAEQQDQDTEITISEALTEWKKASEKGTPSTSRYGRLFSKTSEDSDNETSSFLDSDLEQPQVIPHY